MKLPWQKKPEQKPSKFIGMSQKPTIAGDLAKVLPTQKPVPKKEPKPKGAGKVGLLSPLHPYIAVVTDDIKGLLRIDEESRRKREIYNDFMEEHFKKKN